MSSRKKLIVMVITLSLILILSSSYALLRSEKLGKNSYVINVGDLKVNFQEGRTNALTASNMYPMTDEEGAEVEQELVFTVKNEGSVKAYYNVWIEETSTNPEFKTVIKYIVKKDTEEYNSPVILSEYKYIDFNATLEATEEATYHVKVYLDESADNTYMGKTFNAKIHVEASQESYGKILDLINEKLDDTNSIKDGETTYLSGSNDTINFNYVWYSGKLWRITAVNSDGSIKMITENQITEIYFGENPNYEDSWVQVWLNEDFKDTLYDYQNIIDNVAWNVTIDSNSEPQKPETLSNQKTVSGDVGLLNAYEYYQSYKKLGTEENGYLNIGYAWWTITPYNDTNGWGVQAEDNKLYNTLSIRALGIRPVVVLKKKIEISGGNGTKENPYTIEGDKKVGTSNEKLNNRLSGEYVKFQNDIYRIVGIESDGSTKLTGMDPIKDKNDTVITKAFGTTVNYKSVVESNDETYWGAYLNTTWYNSITSPYKEMLVKGTYYLGTVGYENYKNSLCREPNTTKTIKECEKIENKWVGYVGLPRVGEMFASQLGKKDDNSKNNLTLNPFDENNIQLISANGNLGHCASTDKRDVRPSILLNSKVYITGGEGTEQKPYEVKLAS